MRRFIKSAILFLLSLPIIASLVPVNVFAANSSIPYVDVANESWTTPQKIKSVLYARALIHCFQANGTVSVENASDLSKWPMNSNGVNSTILDPNGDGYLACTNESGWITEALSLWGFTDKIDALCTFGFTRINVTGQVRGPPPTTEGRTYAACFNGTGNTLSAPDTAGEMLTSLQTGLDKGRGLPAQFSNPQKYLLYLQTLTLGAGCNAKQTTKLSSATEEQKALITANAAVGISVIEGVGSAATVTKYVFELQGVTQITQRGGVTSYNPNLNSKDAAIASYTTSTDMIAEGSPGGNGANSCAYIAQLANAFAEDYWQAVKAGQIDIAKDTEEMKATAAEVTPGTSSCAIDGVGWIICPVVNFLASLSDGAFGFLADTFLRTDPEAFKTDSPTYNAWSIMRTIANVAFVIVFLIIIFSQLTSIGISNYGVKKLLPRIVIAAILVNVSYFVCQIAVDLSNILGYSIKDVFGAVGASIGGENLLNAQEISPIASGEGFEGIALGILVIGGVGAGYALLSTLIPVLLAAVVALVMILFILIARQALIILLIVISPLAFVAFLLPNTEGLFKKWRQALTAMLLVFPIVAVVFGASSLASGILSITFTENLEGDTSKWFGQLVAAAVMVLPLFVVPVLLKKSLDGIPAIGQLANKWSSKANGNVGKSVKESYEGSIAGRGRAIRKQERYNIRGRKFAKAVEKGGIASVIAGGFSSLGITESQRAQKEAIRRAASGTAASAQTEAVKQQMKVLQDKVGTRPSDIARHIESSYATMSDTDMQAATDLLLASEGTGDLRRIISNPQIMQRHARSIAESGRRNDGVVRKKSRDLANWFSTQDATVGNAYTGQTAQETYQGAQASKLLTLDKESAQIAEAYIDPAEATRALEDQSAGQLDPETRKVLERRSALAPSASAKSQNP